MIKKHQEQFQRIWMLADIHFGLHAVSMKWLDQTVDYFENFFIPLLKENIKPNDVLFILGDVFDNRLSINSIVLNRVVNLFVDISKLLPIKIIIGNHDTAYKNNNDINSLNIFNYIPNIDVYKDPVVYECCSKNILLIPWRQNNESFLDALKEAKKADYVFCHHDFSGLRYNNFSCLEDGIDAKDLTQVKKVYSGHIHLKQKYRNVQMVGNPFHQTRNDRENSKGIFCLDLETGEELFFENNYSPKFIQLVLMDLMNTPLKQFEQLIRNNIVDLIIKKNFQNSYSWTKFSEILKITNEVKFIMMENEIESSYSLDSNFNQFQINDELNYYLNSLNQSDEVKQLIKDKVKIVYENAINNEKMSDEK